MVPAGADAGGSVVVLVLYCTLGARWNRIAPCCRLGHTSDFLRAQASGEESGGLLGRYRSSVIPGSPGCVVGADNAHAKGEVQMRYSEIRHAPRHAQPRA